MFRVLLLFILIIGTNLSTLTSAQEIRYGILNQNAPSWGVTDWYQLPEGKKNLDISDFKDQVIYLYCFQAWCPGCHKYGFPTLNYVIHQFQDDSHVEIVAVQTSFEGFSYNGFKQAKTTAQKYGLKIPVGQSGSRKKSSKLMINYRTGGTPWVIIIDKQGIVRYNDFHIHPNKAVHIIDQLKQEQTDR